MKPRATIAMTSFQQSRIDGGGFVLIVVLGFLLLITALVLALFVNVTTQVSATKTYANSVAAREMADSVVQVAIGQIRLATASVDSSGKPITWASQPGMIRTFNSSGAAAGAYKLYSSDNMIVTGTPTPGFTDDFDTTWKSNSTLNTALYTDLNAPVSGQFPIIDPRAAGVVGGGTYPLVDGFSYAGTVTSGATSVIIPGLTQPASSTDSSALLPMPVKWIYILKDGTMTVPSSGSGTTAIWSGSGSNVPSSANPIVGRVAFWTDDETCKLNVNTACGGTYWDAPRYLAGMDLAYSRYKPAAGEYNRYPGHPATTSLLPVFWSYAGLTSPNTNLVPVPTPLYGTGITTTPSSTGTMAGNGGASWCDAAPSWGTSNSVNIFQSLLNFSPRNSSGGSVEGTVATTGWNWMTGTSAVSFTTPAAEFDRLYSTVDEALFAAPATATPNAARTPISFTTSSGTTSLAASDVEKLRFFLTTNSRTPEMNPFNLPKISLWPQVDTSVGTVPKTRTATDNLLAFCSTLNGQSYYFTRQNSVSPTADFSSSTTGGARNQKIFNYLTGLWSNSIPGFGASMQSRYTLDGDNRIATLMYDYLRGTVNLFDTTGATAAPFPSSFMAQTTYSAEAYGQVTPISITAPNGTTYKGLGRFPGVKQVAIMFIATAANQAPLLCVPSGVNMGRPLLFDSTGSSLLDSNYNLTSTGITDVLTGAAYAASNPMHPVVTSPGTNSLPPAVVFIKQYISGSNPVLAIDPNKLTVNPDDTSAIYPVFDTSSWHYPTISDSSTAPATATSVIIKVGAGNAATITPSGGSTYNYNVATTTTPGSSLPAQTHAGLPYLTVPDVANCTSTFGHMEGAYDVPNPRYQGKNSSSGTYTTLPDATQTSVASTNLTPGMTQIQAIMIIDMVDPAAGQIGLNPYYQIEISGLGAFQVDGQSLGFQNDMVQTPSAALTTAYQVDPESSSFGRRYATGKTGFSQLNFVSSPVIVGTKAPTTSGATVGGIFSFTGGPIVVKIYTPNSSTGTALASATSNSAISSSNLIQTLNINFPSATMTSNAPGFPTPLLAPLPASTSSGYLVTASTGVTAKAPVLVSDLAPSFLLTFDAGSVLSTSPNNGVGAALYATANPITHIALGANAAANPDTYYILPERTTGLTASNGAASDYHSKLTADTIRSIEVLYGDTRLVSSLTTVPSNFYAPHKLYFDATMRSAHSLSGCLGGTANFLSSTYTSSTATSLAFPGWNYTSLLSGTQNYGGYGVPQTTGTSPVPSPTQEVANLVGATPGNGLIKQYFPNVTSSTEFNDSIFSGTDGSLVWNGLTKFSNVWALGGDFENGPALDTDEPVIGKMDEADFASYSGASASTECNPDYYDATLSTTATYKNGASFSPNRLVASSVMFGSLPIPVDANTPGGAPDPSMSWRTLLFCPNPASYNSAQTNASQTRTAVQQVAEAGAVPTAGNVPDFLFLDFFNMPVVAPYAVSEPFSTSGKVNMNYQIAPFSYITRNTALRGVLRDSVLTAVSDSWVSTYKYSGVTTTTPTGYWTFLTSSGQWGFRYPISATETLKQFAQRFSNNDIFRSPSEICSLWLYPATQPTSNSGTGAENPNTALVAWDSANANIKAWWYANPTTTCKSLTGDDQRERPYATIYPRLTTQSNSYTVHFRVQVLQKVASSAANQWADGTDVIGSEYRGSSVVERYLDPGDTTIPDVVATVSANSTAVPTLDANYKFRIVATKRFAP